MRFEQNDWICGVTRLLRLAAEKIAAPLSVRGLEGNNHLIPQPFLPRETAKIAKEIFLCVPCVLSWSIGAGPPLSL